MRKFLNFGIVLFALSGEAKVPTNKEFVLGSSQEFETLNPMIYQTAIASYIGGLTIRVTTVIGTNGKWIPEVIKVVPSFENKMARVVNGKTVAEMEIKEAAKWSDGKPMVCEDFALAREIGLSPNVSVGEKDQYSKVDKIEWPVNNPKKCTWTFKEARWDFYQLGTFRPVPAHIEGPIFKQFGDKPEGYEKNSMYTRNPTLPGLANGPYMYSEVKVGSHVTLVRNPHFYGPPAKIEELTIKVIPNSATLEANLRSGTIDSISSLGITFDQAISFEKKVQTEGLPFKVMFEPSATYEHIDLNLDNPILKDIRVRKALVHAINRDELVKALFEGKQIKALHNISPQDKEWFTDDPKKITLYPFDRKKAAELLDAAGWKKGSGDYREKDGKRLSLIFQTTSGNKVRETVQVFVQNQLKAVGVEVLIKNEPAKVFFGETVRKRKGEGMLMYAWVASPGVPSYSTQMSEMIPSESNGFSGQNVPGWRNAEVDSLMSRIKVEMDPKKRKEIIHKVLKHYTDDVPVIPLYYRSDIAVVPKNLKNFDLPGHQFYETHHAEYWDLQ